MQPFVGMLLTVAFIAQAWSTDIAVAEQVQDPDITVTDQARGPIYTYLDIVVADLAWGPEIL